MAYQLPSWVSLGHGMYRNWRTGEYKSEKLEAEGAHLGFRIIGEIATGELSGLVGENI